MFNKIKAYCSIALLLISASAITTTYSQTTEPEYAVTAYINGGYSRFISELDDNDLNKNGYSGTIRIMWEPEYMLSLGIESGYIHLYSFETHRTLLNGTRVDGTAELNAVPVLVIYSMRLYENFKVTVGTGLFILTSKVDALGNSVESSQLSTGILLGASYLVPLSSTLALGGEVKYYLINKIEDAGLNFQVSFQYRFLVY